MQLAVGEQRLLESLLLLLRWQSATAAALPMQFRDPQPPDSAIKLGNGRRLGALVAPALFHARLRPLTRLLGRLLVNHLGALGLVGQHRDHIVIDFEKAASDEHANLFAALTNAQFTKVERRQQGRVARQNRHPPFAARRVDRLGLAIEDAMLRGDDGHV